MDLKRLKKRDKPFSVIHGVKRVYLGLNYPATSTVA